MDVRHVEEGRHFEDTFVDIEKKINMKMTVEDLTWQSVEDFQAAECREIWQI